MEHAIAKLLIVTIISDEYLPIFKHWIHHHSKLRGAVIHLLCDSGAPLCKQYLESSRLEKVTTHEWTDPFTMKIYKEGVVERILKSVPHEFHLTLDVDEFWENDGCTELAIRSLTEQDASYIPCYFIDRFAAHGEIISLAGVEDIFASFPLETNFTVEVVKAMGIKCAFAKSGMYGGHQPEYWLDIPAKPTANWMALHHFRYYSEARVTNEKKVSLFMKEGWGREYVKMRYVLNKGLQNIARYLMTDLEKLARSGSYKTDKQGAHSYLRPYAWYFRHLVGTPCRILEIGVKEGGSLELWRDWFGPAAEVTGIEISEMATPAGTRVIYADAYKLETIASFDDQSFDVIIDDGSHDWKDVAACIIGYLPKVKPGGYLCIEDEAPWSPHFGMLRKAFPNAELLDFSELKGFADKLFIIRKPSA